MILNPRKLFSNPTVAALLLSFALAAPALHAPQVVWAAPQTSGTASTAAAPVPDFGTFESYATRPDILSLTPQAHPELRGDWQKLKRGHLEAVAQMVGLYPERELYFLARDSELLYDLARYYFKDDPKTLTRIHLLNASRLNMRAEHVREYLKQEGISEAALRGGRQVVFIDTGFSGTIPRVLSEYFPAELRGKLQTHLLSSSNPSHPSSRVFLTSINPAAATMNPGSLHGSVVSYEHLPRFTDRSSQFRQDATGRWHPVSSKSGAGDGAVSKEKARAYQEDLLAYARTDEAREQFAARLSQWRELRGMLDAGDGAALESKLKQLLAESPNDPYTEALVRDLIDASQRTLLSEKSPALTPDSVGLSEIAITSGSMSNKNLLIKKYPQWSKILENPETGIASLIAQKEWGTLGAITDVIQDMEFSILVYSKLGGMTPTAESRAFIQMLIEKGDQGTLQSLAQFTFSQPHTAPMTDLLRLVIEKADQNTLQYLAMFTFSKPHTAPMTDLLRIVIEKADQKTLQSFAYSTFSQPHTAPMTDLLRIVIEKADQKTLQSFAYYTFSEPHTAEMTDLLRIVIEKADQHTLQSLAHYTFRKPHTKTQDFESLRAALQIPDPEKRRQFLLQKLGPAGGGASVAAKAEAVSESVQTIPAKTASETLTSASAVPDSVKISTALKAGQKVVTPAGRKLEVIRAVDQGKRGVVFQVKDLDSGTVYALKAAKDSGQETLASIADESKKKGRLAELGLPHAAMIEQSELFVVTEWVEGVRGDQWVDAWLKAGAPADAPEALALRALMEASAEKKVYIGDLNPKNLIYQAQSGAQPGRWVIVDSGSIRQDLTQAEILERYRENIVRRWSKGQSAAEAPLRALLAAPPKCSIVLSGTLTDLLAK